MSGLPGSPGCGDAPGHDDPRESGLPRWYAEAAGQRPQAPALVAGARSVSYGELAQRVGEESQRMRQRGLGPGSCLVLARPGNSEAWITGLLASLTCGANPILIDSAWPAARRRECVRSLQPEALLEETSEIRKLPGAGISAGRRPSRRAPPGLWLFSSGTSGLPNPHLRPIRRLTEMVARVARRLPASLAGDRPACLSMVPLHHGFGLVNSLLLVHALGGTAVLEPVLRLRRFPALVRKHSVKMFFATPRHYRVLTRPGVWNAPALSSLAWCISSTGPLDEAVARRFAELSGTRIRQQYGTTETGPLCLDSDATAQGGSCVGRPLPGISLSVRSAQGDALPVGTTGYLALRFDDGWTPALPWAGDGYHFIGDRGMIDRHHRVHVLGRRGQDTPSASG